MIVTSNNFELKLEEIEKDLPTKKYHEHENIVLNLISGWFSKQKYFQHQTSGSTGRPKKIEISREQIEISARATMDFLDPEGSIRTSLLCLAPRFIGGAMVVYRALIFNHDLHIAEPSSNLNSLLDSDQTYDLVSMVPMQFQQLSPSSIHKFKNVLIGGAPMPVDQTNYDTNIYSTYGMTETVSHIALRRLDEDRFKTVGDAIVQLSEQGTLQIRGVITGGQWIQTNDIAEVLDERTFKWLGRADFVINSGGIKIHPEQVESQLIDQLDGDFMATSIPDDRFGEKLILLIAEDDRPLDFSSITPYHRPKEVYFNQTIFKTAGNKMDRNKTHEHFLSNL